MLHNSIMNSLGRDLRLYRDISNVILKYIGNINEPKILYMPEPYKTYVNTVVDFMLDDNFVRYTTYNQEENICKLINKFTDWLNGISIRKGDMIFVDDNFKFIYDGEKVIPLYKKYEMKYIPKQLLIEDFNYNPYYWSNSSCSNYLLDLVWFNPKNYDFERDNFVRINKYTYHTIAKGINFVFISNDDVEEDTFMIYLNQSFLAHINLYCRYDCVFINEEIGNDVEYKNDISSFLEMITKINHKTVIVLNGGKN